MRTRWLAHVGVLVLIAAPVRADPGDPCADVTSQELIAAADAASTRTQLRAHAQPGTAPETVPRALSVLPGGATVAVDVAAVAPKPSVYCARFVDRDEPGHDKPVPVLDAVASTGQQPSVTLTLAVPDIGFMLPEKRNLVAASFATDETGHRTRPSGVAVVQRIDVSNGRFAFVVAAAAVLIAYLLVVIATRRSGEKFSFNPVSLTAGKLGTANLSQFQIFGFTLIVLWLLVFALFRTSALCDISDDVLLLLGISAAGTAGAKVAGVAKKRLSFDNWSWLRNRGWLTAYEAGCDAKADPKQARWSDLLKTCGTFDVYSFQLATVSAVVGASMLSSDLNTLATFTIPANLLKLLGLSNVVYVGGKAIDPNSMAELDERTSALRTAEKTWVSKVAPQMVAIGGQAAKAKAAITAAPDEYAAYITTAREVARMLKSLYGKDAIGTDGTKFVADVIDDAELMPEFP